MKFLIMSTAAAFLVALAPCSVRAADVEPPSQDAATGGATTQPAVPQKIPAVPSSACTAPQQYCLDRDALNRAIFLPRPDEGTQPAAQPKDNIPRVSPNDDSDRYRLRDSERNWNTASTADRVDQFLDDHLGGFGKMEVQRPGYKMRFEYIYGRRCKVKGVGVCMSINF